MKDIVYEALEYADAADRVKVVSVDDVAMWLPQGYEEIVTVFEVVDAPTDAEIRELAYQVWLKDQTRLIDKALSDEALAAAAIGETDE